MSDAKAFPAYQGNPIKGFNQVSTFQAIKGRWRNMALWGMGTALGLSLVGNVVQAVSIAVMLPLQRIETVYLAAHTDGTIDATTRLSDLPATAQEAITRSAVWLYVEYRRSYLDNYALEKTRYDTVSRMSAPGVRQAYQQWFLPSNPASPQNLIGKNGQIDVSLISINFKGNAAFVRYWQEVTLNGAKHLTSRTAVVTFAHARVLTAKARLADPAGLIVTDYQDTGDST